MTDTMVTAALEYSARGWPVFPCRPGRKEPLTEHGVLEATTDQEQIRAWWARWPDANIGIATGQPGPDVADFDTYGNDTAIAAFSKLTEAGILAGYGHMIRTRSGGLHLYYQGTTQRNGRIPGQHVDFRSSGGYVIAPPSYVEADDKGPAGEYQMLSSADAAAELEWRIVRDLVDPPPPFQQPAHERAALNGSARAGDDFAAQTSWAEILAPHGWTLARELGDGVRYWLRPGKTGRGISASTRDTGGLYVFTTSTEFEPEQPYSKFATWAILQGYGANYSAAAAALRTQGYGEQPQPAALAVAAAAPQNLLDQWRAALITTSELDNLPEPQPLIDGILYLNSLAWMHGKPGHGKSFIALDWASCVASGLPWQMHETSQGNVLYIIAEGVTGLRPRIRAWEDHARRPSNVAFLPVAVQFPVMTHLAAITQLAAELSPSLVVVDTQARVSVGRDENSAKDMGEFVAAADHLRNATGACVLIVHHEARAGDNMRGSTALEGAATTLVRVIKDGSQLRVENPKQKDAEPFEPIRMRLVPRLSSAVCMALDGETLRQELNESERKMIEALRDFGPDGAYATALRDVCGLAKATYYRTVNSLVSRGVIISERSGTSQHFMFAPEQTVSQSQPVSQSLMRQAVAVSQSHHPFRGETTETETPRETENPGFRQPMLP